MTVGTALAIWWSVTLPSIGLMAIVAYLAARCLQQRPIRYRLRTLMIVLALGPPVLAALWLYWDFQYIVFLGAFAFATGSAIAFGFDTISKCVARIWNRG